MVTPNLSLTALEKCALPTDFSKLIVLAIFAVCLAHAETMVPVRYPLPEELAERAFSSRRATSLGVTPKMLHGPRFVQLHHGVHAHVDRKTESGDFPEAVMLRMASDYLSLLRQGEAFSHTAALLLYEAPILVEPAVHVTVIFPRAAAAGRKVRGHRTRHRFQPVLTHNVLSCVPPELALVQSESMLSFRELVVAIDHLILPRRKGEPARPMITREWLGEYLRAYSGKGATRLRAAFEISRIGAESRYETLSRFELARMGIDTLELQANLYDHAGHWIGRFDLADKAKRKILEYDGEQHRTDRAQYLRDEKRLQAARDANYEVKRLHKEDLRSHALASTRRELCKFLGETPRRLPRRLERYFAEPL